LSGEIDSLNKGYYECNTIKNKNTYFGIYSHNNTHQYPVLPERWATAYY